MNHEEPEFNPEDQDQVDRALEGEFTRPCAEFQGKLLWPFTPGSKALYNMALSEFDTKLYRALAFVFIHIRRGEKDMETDLAKHIVPLVWNNMDHFRVKALGLCNTLNDGDIDAVISIVKKEFQMEEMTEISATPPDHGQSTQKKRGATTRRKSDGKHSRQPKS